MKLNFDKEFKKEKNTLFKSGNKSKKLKLPKETKDLVILAGSAILLSQAIRILHD